MEQRDVALGLAVGGVRAGLAAGKVALLPLRLAARAPVVGPPLHRMGDDLAHQGSLTRARARAQLETLVGEIMAAPEIERAVDRLLAGPLMDAVGRSVAEHRVVERVALQIVATTDMDRVVAAVLDHEDTLLAVDRVLSSPEMDRVVEYIATSPRVMEAVSAHTATLADEMVTNVRDRTHTVDEVAERTFRSWLRRPPRPEPT